MRYQAVIFDFDGTLFDTEYNEMTALDTLVTQVTGVRPPRDKLLKTFGMTGPDGIRYLGCDEEQAAWVAPRWHEASLRALETTQMFSGMPETLRSLHGMGVRLGIVTSRGISGVNTGLRAQGLTAYFDTIVSQKDTVRHKPYPDPLLECLRRMGLDNDAAIYIGDSAGDMQAAAAAGMASGLALWGTHDPALPCTYRLAHPREILTLCEVEE